MQMLLLNINTDNFVHEMTLYLKPIRSFVETNLMQFCLYSFWQIRLIIKLTRTNYTMLDKSQMPYFSFKLQNWTFLEKIRNWNYHKITNWGGGPPDSHFSTPNFIYIYLSSAPHTCY